MDPTMSNAALRVLTGFPVKIVALIFAYCLSLEREALPWPQNIAPVNISQVNRAWRSIALSTPSLWTSLSVHIPSTFSSPLLDLYLQRSSSTPLSVELYVEDGVVRDPHSPKFEGVVTTLLRSSLRWRDISISVPGAVDLRYLAFIFDLQSSDLPLLNRAAFTIRTPVLWDVVRFSESLRGHFWENVGRRSQLRIISSSLSLPEVAFFWNHITHITITTYSPQLVSILRQCSSLASLDASVDTRKISDSTPFTLLSLVHLSLNGQGSADVMGTIRVPNLRRFNTCSGRTLLRLRRLLEESGANLEELRFDDASRGIHHFKSILPWPVYSSLRSVHLPHTPDASVLLDAMTVNGSRTDGGGGGLPLPKLARLVIRVTSETSSDVLLKFVESRRPSTSAPPAFTAEPFRSLKLIAEDTSAGADVFMLPSELKAFGRDESLVVKVTSSVDYSKGLFP